jgi:hypothetical protein
MQMQMGKSFEMQQQMGLQQEGESDEVKRIFLEGNPYLLVCSCLALSIGSRSSGCCA